MARAANRARACALVQRGQWVAREDISQRAEHRHDRRAHPAGGGDRHALPAHDPCRAEREREREERGTGVEEVDRELLSERQPQDARQNPERDRVERQHRNRRQRRVPITAQICDQPPALRHGEQHRVEGEQEPDERADRREQLSRLVALRRRLGEQRRFVGGALDIQATRGKRAQRGSHATLRALGGLHQDAPDAPVQPRHFLSEEQRHNRNRARHQRADLLFAQLRVQRRQGRASRDLEGDFPTELRHAKRPRQGRGQHDRTDASKRRQRGVAHQRAVERREARVGTDQLDRPAASGADRVGADFKQRRRDAHPRYRTYPREHALRKTVRASRHDLQRRVAGDPLRQRRDRALQAGARHLRGEQQRHSRRYAHHREALLRPARAQAHPVETQGVCELHGRAPPSSAYIRSTS